MDIRKLLIDDIKALLASGTNAKDIFLASVTEAKRLNDKYIIFEKIRKIGKCYNSEGLLANVPYALKDNFSTIGIETTASSNILNGYIPVYDATVYKKLKESGAVLVGKTTLDELAMGGTGTTGHLGTTLNPWDEHRLIGGSSSGSAAAVAAGVVPFAIGSDTGDSVRKPAAFGGVVGFKPTYGRISRYGLFAFASSLDHVGVLSRCVKDAALVTDVLKGFDPMDMTSLPNDNVNYVDVLNNDIKGKKLFYFKDICNIDYYENSTEELKAVLASFKETVEKARELGFEVEEVEFNKELLSAVYPTYMILSCAEATSNNANLTGIQFGPRGQGQSIEEIMFNARTVGFSELIKRRFVIGSYVLQKENQEKLFLNAARVRRMIVNEMNKLFEKYDGLILPASGSVAPLIGQMSDSLSEQYKLLENHLAIGNFGGMPSITIPSGLVNGLPIGINITGKAKNDALVLNMAAQLESVLGYKGLVKEVDHV